MDQTLECKKVFFLYPHSVIRDEMITEIIRNEYEVYFVFDHKKLFKLLLKYKEALLFINIDEVLNHDEWEDYITKIMNKEELRDIRIGVLSYNKNPELQKRFLMEIMVPCGFIKLSLGVKESTKIILKTLEVNEVKGRRKYIRAKGEDSRNTSFSLSFKGQLYKGKILDISSAGMAIQFEQKTDIRLRTYLTDVQLKLKGVVCKVSGIVGAVREGSQPVMVIMFDHRMIDNQTREKISTYVFRRLQESITEEIKGITVQF